MPEDLPLGQSDSEPHPARVAFLDGWRGMAILLVLVSHFGGPTVLGALGVHAFFVLSGVLTARVLFVDKMPLTEFYRRRVARILPALYVFLLVVYATAWAFGCTESPEEIGATMLFLRSYWPPGADGWLRDLPLAHLWSLNVEEHAYVALSLVAALSARRLGSAAVMLASLALACACAYAWHRLQPPSPHGTFFPTLTECAALSIMLSAAICLFRSQPDTPPPTWFGAACLGFVVLGVVFFANKLTVQFVAIPIALAILINTLDDGRPWLRQLLEVRWLGHLGKCSFSIYLWQQPAHFLWLRDKLPMHPVLGCIISVAIGVAFFALVERPARRWINGFSYREIEKLAPKA